MAKPVEIDGAYTAGGGHLMRSAIALSLLTGRSVHIHRFGSGRNAAGVQTKHIAALNAVLQIAPESRVRGANLNDREISFEPGPVHAGRFELKVRTAGSASLVLQAAALPLALAGRRSLLRVDGPTHVPNAPTFEFLKHVWHPTMTQLGLSADLSLERAGFSPHGRGQLAIGIDPLDHPFRPMIRTGRPKLQRLQLLSHQTSDLSRGTDRRQCDGFLGVMRFHRSLVGELLDIERHEGRFEFTGSTGATFCALATFDSGVAGFQQLGAREHPPERVGEAAARELVTFLRSGAAVDPHTADQIMLPLALAGGQSSFTTPEVTPHMQAQAYVIAQFLDVAIDFVGERPVRVDIRS